MAFGKTDHTMESVKSEHDVIMRSTESHSITDPFALDKLKEALPIFDAEMKSLSTDSQSSELYDKDATKMDSHFVSHVLEYYKDKFLGHGSYGQVFEGKYKGKAVAVKRIPSHRYVSQTDRERDIMLKLNHPNVVQLLDVITGKKKTR